MPRSQVSTTPGPQLLPRLRWTASHTNPRSTLIPQLTSGQSSVHHFAVLARGGLPKWLEVDSGIEKWCVDCVDSCFIATALDSPPQHSVYIRIRCTRHGHGENSRIAAKVSPKSQLWHVRDRLNRSTTVMPPGRSRRKICPRCHKWWTRQTVHRHLILGCTRREQEASRRKALENVLSPPRRQNLPLRLRNNPPSSPRPPPVSPRRRKRGRGPGRKRKRRNSRSDRSGSDSDPDAFTPPPAEDVRLRSRDFAFDTPGAGPSNGQPQAPRLLDDEPYRFFADEWDGNVPIDSDSDDGRPDGPNLANHAPWLDGLTASAVLAQELEAEIARTGGKWSRANLANYPVT